MKTFKILLLALIGAFTLQTHSQTAEEIVNNYFENTGGLEAWGKLEGLKMSANVNQGGMTIPIDIYQFKNGKTATVINLQGQQFMQNVFDGESFWGTNFQTMKAEKMDAEANENAKLDLNDFPDVFYNWKEKGYTLELLGKEEFEGTETFKIKVTMEPYTVDGNKEENIAYYYFDTENFVPLGRESEQKYGAMKGMVQVLTFSDYQEVGEIFMPFSWSQGIKGGQSQAITFDSIDLNPTVDDSMFVFPEEAASNTTEDKKN